MKYESIATLTHGDVTIMLYFDTVKDSIWEVYYRKPDYPFMFAFGLGNDLLEEEAMDIAVKNIDNYSDMFD